MNDANMIPALDERQIQRMVVVAVAVDVVNFETIGQPLAKPILGALGMRLQPCFVVRVQRRLAHFLHADAFSFAVASTRCFLYSRI